MYLDSYTLLSPLGKDLLSERCIDDLYTAKYITLSYKLINYLEKHTVNLDNFYDIHQRVKDLLFL